MNVLIAFAVVGGVGLLAGILLALISHFFGVPEDEKVKALRACLPGINCGACGFKGCDDYAAAMAEKNAKPNLCVPGSQSVAEQLSSVLGVKADAVEPTFAFVGCNGYCGATSKKITYEGIKTCRAASSVYGGPNSCTYGCVGFGDCAAACPVGAICIIDGIAHINSELCIGCGLCTSLCPKKLIKLIPKKSNVAVMCSSAEKGAEARKLCKSACIGCKKCEKTCTFGAITVVNNFARIDYEKCTGCGACQDACPTKCLKLL